MKPSTGLTRLQRVSEKKLRTARTLRGEMTPAEKALWEQVRGRKCGGFKIRRQQVVERRQPGPATSSPAPHAR